MSDDADMRRMKVLAAIELVTGSLSVDTPTQLLDFYTNTLRFSEYGEPGWSMEFLRDALEVVVANSMKRLTSEPAACVIDEMTLFISHHAGACFVLQWLESVDLTEHVGNLCSSSLTSRGASLLAGFLHHGTIPDAWEIGHE